MNTPFLWIISPFIAAIFLVLLRRYRLVSMSFSILFSLILCILTLLIPVGEPTPVGPIVLSVSDKIVFFGRQFILGASELNVLTIIYGGLTFWLGAIYFVRVHWSFLPLCLIITALLTAVLAVRPFVYAALFIEIMTILSIPLLTNPGSRVGRGILRFLTFQTIGMPFILYSGWMLSGVESGFPQPDLILRSAVLMGLGFVLLLAVFPFHTWLAMVMEDAHPYAAAFVLTMLSLNGLLFGVELIYSYSWLKESPLVHIIIALAGVSMVLVSGVGSAVQNHFGRLLGFSMMSEIGYSLLALGLAYTNGLTIFFALLPVRILGMGIWALCLANLYQMHRDLSFEKLNGAGFHYPWSSLGIILAGLSTLGMPLLAGFSTRYALWELLAEQNMLLFSGLLVGTIGLMISIVRSGIVLFSPPGDGDELCKESILVRLMLGIGIGCLLFLGLFPQTLAPLINGMQRMFETAAR